MMVARRASSGYGADSTYYRFLQLGTGGEHRRHNPITYAYPNPWEYAYYYFQNYSSIMCICLLTISYSYIRS